MVALPLLRFDTADLPPAQRLDCWRDAVGVTHDITSLDGIEPATLRAASDVWRLGQSVISHRRFPAFRFARPARRARVDGIDHYSLVLMRDGSWGGDADGREIAVGPGQMFLLDLARPVDNRVSASASLRVMLPRALLDAALPVEGGLHGLVLQGTGGALLADYLESLLRRLDDISLAEAPHVEQATTAMIAACIAPSQERSARAAPAIDATMKQRVRRHVEAHIANAALDPAQICRAIGLSRSALYRLFAPEGGVATYIQDRRLARVRTLLSDPRERRRISELAYAHGFSNEVHFSRAFRRAFGVSASELRGAAAEHTAPVPKAVRAPELYQRWVRG